MHNTNYDTYIGESIHVRPVPGNQHVQQGSMSAHSACPGVTTNVAEPFSFPNQDIPSNQLVQAVFVNNEVYGKDLESRNFLLMLL